MTTKFKRSLALVLALSSGLAPTLSSAQSYVLRMPVEGLKETEPTGPRLSLSSRTITFPNQAVGQSTSAAVVVTNTGTAPANFSAITLSGSSAFAVDSSLCLAGLQPNETCAIGLTFAPVVRGLASGSVRLAAGGQSETITLSGAGLQGVLRASVNSLDFGEVPQSSSNSRSASISNIGDLPVSGINLSTSMPYSVSSDCSALAAGDSCNFTIQFAPTAMGQFPGSLGVSSSVGSLSVGLTGTVTAPIPQDPAAASIVSGSPLDFGQAPQGSAPADRVVTLRNTGDLPMTLTGVSGLPASVTVVANTCSNVSAEQSCSITLRMNTDALSAFSGVSAMTAGAQSNAAIVVSGAVVEATSIASLNPASLTFGSVLQDSAAVDRVVSITNTGNSPLSVTGVDNLPTGVSLTANSCAAVAPGADCSITLRMDTSVITAFSGREVTVQGGSSAASLSISGAVQGPTSIATRTTALSLSFGSVVQGSTPVYQTVGLRNDGTVAMTIGSLTGLPAIVKIDSNSCSAVAPGASCEIVLRMDTNSATSFSNTNVTTTGATTNTSVRLSGAVTGANSIAAITAGANPNFGTLYRGEFADRTITLKNNGTTPMTITGMNNLRSGVTMLSTTCTSVAPAGTCSVVLRAQNPVSGLPAPVSSNLTYLVNTIGATTNASTRYSVTFMSE